MLSRRSKRYFFRRSARGLFQKKIHFDTWNMLLSYGMAGTFVDKDEHGKVRVRMLSLAECMAFQFDKDHKIYLPPGVTLLKSENA